MKVFRVNVRVVEVYDSRIFVEAESAEEVEKYMSSTDDWEGDGLLDDDVTDAQGNSTFTRTNIAMGIKEDTDEERIAAGVLPWRSDQ